MTLLHLLPLVDVPPITPNFDAPWMKGVQVIVSYILGTALVLMILALIFAIVSLVTSILPDGARSWAGKNIVKVFIATAALAGISGLFQWIVNFNFGF
ncbi:hypothetical protein ITJ43_14710 [Microbacterium sp. VKM Ac-2870]|uniref:hypothetical protein n=1 Tax=Microbacterium sp. VKM Ac-2870 TaxID=2783825 RepID=UPI00188A2B43|nr:hypothetical protein [Microbacterium sp. VKM Ac-2870]MBF4563381.1 hypothetical protein [Microbacterium sp. VKM Ac-2870]